MPQWNAGTQNSGATYVEMQFDCNLAIHINAHNIVWTSNSFIAEDDNEKDKRGKCLTRIQGGVQTIRAVYIRGSYYADILRHGKLYPNPSYW
jgi:hypothetical protein